MFEKQAIEHQGQIIRSFLEDPNDRERFEHFFALALRLAKSHVALLVRRGLRVPLSEYPAASAVEDCALECLGTLLKSKPGRPCYLITDYFRVRIDTETPPERIMALLQGIIAGHIGQELMRFTPQVVVIRRAVLRAMAVSTFEEVRLGGRDHWTLRSTQSNRRGHLPELDDSVLYQFINEACQRFPNMPERCRTVFELLDMDDRFRNLIESKRFLSALIRTLTDHDDSNRGQSTDPRTEYVCKVIRLCTENAVDLTLREIMPKQAAKRVYTDPECEAYRRALANLMNDFIQDGDHDSLPTYLKEAMNGCAETVYLQRHKYSWETLVTKCKEHLREMLRGEGFAPPDAGE